MDLSIIVPVYNVEKYIRGCILSIFQQGLEDKQFEVIIVNDGTTDRSIETIEDIINQHQNIIIINQENQGLSIARNNGIGFAKGDYILFVDPDDVLINYSLSPLLNKVLEKKVDLVVANYLEIKEEGIIQQPSLDNTRIIFLEKTGKELFLELNPRICYVWRAIYRKGFIIRNHIKFIPNIYYEDIAFTHECYLKANKCLQTYWPLYIYRKRTGSITNSFTTKNAESFIIAIANTWNLIYDSTLSSTVKYKLEENVYILFTTVIYHILHSIKSSIQRKNLIDFLNLKAPKLAFKHSLRQKIITFMIKRMPHFYIESYYIYSKFMY